MTDDDRFHSSLEHGLAAAADGVDPGDPSAMLGAVRSTVQHRRRRRQVITGVAAVGVLAASGVAIANVVSTDGSDMIVSAPADEPADTTVDTGTGNGSGSDDSIPEDAVPAGEAVGPPVDSGQTDPTATGEPLRVTPSRTEALVDGGLSVAQRNSGGAQLFEWNDGFLALYTEYTPRPLPTELPESVVAQFPQEVQDLFVDGLPPTIDEAITMLEDAGLFDEVSDIVTSNPEVQAAIYGEQSEPITTVRTSSDGVEWSDVAASFPIPRSQWMTTSSTGDRFVIVTQTGGGFGPEPDLEPATATTMDIWSSTDLVTWESQTVTLPAEPVDQSNFLTTNSGVQSVAVGDDAWVLTVSTYTDIDPYSFLDDAERAASDSGSLSVGTSSNDEGFSVQIYEVGDDGSSGDTPPQRTITKTWAELGLDGSPFEGLGSAAAYSAQWGGEPEQVETVPALESSQLMAIDDGFVAFGEDLALSSDGVAWSPVALPVDGFVDWVIDTDDGLLVSVSSFEGTSLRYRFDPASSEFTPVDLDGVPFGTYPEQRDRGAVVLTDTGDGGDDAIGSGGSLAVAEVDGYRFELDYRVDTTSTAGGEPIGSVTYTLTAVASGAVVSTETLDSAGDGEFEFAKEEYDVGPGEEEGFRLLDPATGEDLVEVPYSMMTFTSLDADGNPIEDSATAAPAEYDVTIARWLVAAVGDALIVEQLSVDRPEPVDGEFVDENYISSVVTGTDAVLLAYSDGSIVRITPEP
ncbi:MAG: hypothetical protein ABJ382_15320 [Ilumatobacter sp.]